MDVSEEFTFLANAPFVITLSYYSTIKIKDVYFPEFLLHLFQIKRRDIIGDRILHNCCK
jgi:hypothetical protein